MALDRVSRDSSTHAPGDSPIQPHFCRNGQRKQKKETAKSSTKSGGSVRIVGCGAGRGQGGCSTQGLGDRVAAAPDSKRERCPSSRVHQCTPQRSATSGGGEGRLSGGGEMGWLLHAGPVFPAQPRHHPPPATTIIPPAQPHLPKLGALGRPALRCTLSPAQPYLHPPPPTTSYHPLEPSPTCRMKVDAWGRSALYSQPEDLIATPLKSSCPWARQGTAAASRGSLRGRASGSSGSHGPGRPGGQQQQRWPHVHEAG